ncbi:restriction endonuclease [Bradyrhizobium oligotrophicum]|uniref:restriction endonuclease n=1 Tax=Bradyrhizobium oligotrophicum TaxID=44255 RepID=UPI003EC1415E
MTQTISNAQRGTDFETYVARLFRSSTGHRNVREQQHICGKNVDIIFEKQWNPHKYRTIAVECKNWRSGLDRNAVGKIYFDYKPLFDQKMIDELWIVTPNPVSPTVQEHIDAFVGIEILHLSELERDIIDFTLYATYLRDKFEKDQLSNYYIPSRLEGSNTTAHAVITDWLTQQSPKPIAIWAGYGMGKTSYATFLAHELALNFLRDPTGRIPILIPLGDFYTAPRLDGLFANVLTKDSGVHGYNFNTFWNLHEAGRFVIILDGFDEMKHAMTRAEFANISREIRKLCLPNSRVLLLGRPDAIISGEEHKILTKGTRTVADLEISDNLTSEFTELRLDFFSEPEYREFLRKYLECFYSGPDRESFIEDRLSQLSSLGLEDLIRRPVQARMLAQILLNPKNSLENVSKYDLYNMFIDDCFAREEEKPERRKTERSVRRTFMQDIAWWLWAIKRTRTFTVNDIPLKLARDFTTEGDQIGQLRELLIGSVVEEKSIGSLLTEKDAGTFYFPHLSFTEFLVAEYIIQRTLGNEDIENIAQLFDPEIREFVESYKETDGLYKLYRDLRGYTGELPYYVIAALATSRTVRANVEIFKQTPVDAFWQFSVEFMVLLEDGNSTATLRRCGRLINLADPRSTAIASQLLLKTSLDRPNIRSAAATVLMLRIFQNINLDKLNSTVRHPFVDFRISAPAERFFVTLLSSVSIDHKDETVSMDLSVMYKHSLAVPHSIVDEKAYASTTIKIQRSDIAKSLTTADRRKFESWFEAARDGLIFDRQNVIGESVRSRPRFV